ncbi:ABC transporter substrate-binding protein [Hamadaea tsunoensis]|uniref:ABC transporter substrate-binding protein n=1 Tax=Hamadaea tsunoensis TaxID=53368 RepID=UPI00047F219E|nr:ABC transporter substrate-binding protein [Hamadaea tsunoensis]
MTGNVGPLLPRRSALRALGGLALGGMGLGTLGACSATPSSATPSATIAIGLIVPDTDAYKSIGADILDGFQLYTDLNRPFGRYDVSIVTAEEKAKGGDNVAIVDGLLKHGVSAIVGVAAPTTLLAVREKIETAHVPFIGANLAPASLKSVFWMWNTAGVAGDPGEALGGYLRTNNRTVVVVGSSALASTDAVDGFRKGYQTQIPASRILRTEAMSPGAIADRIGSIDPGAIFLALSGDEGIAVLKALRGSHITTEVYAPGDLTEGAALDDVIEALGEKGAAGIYTALNYAADLQNPSNQLFTSRFRSASQGRAPSVYAVAGWDAAQAIDKAIRAAGQDSVTREVLNAKLGNLGQIDSPRGAIAFNQTRTPLQKWYLRRVMKDGPKLANVTVRTLATLG